MNTKEYHAWQRKRGLDMPIEALMILAYKADLLILSDTKLKGLEKDVVETAKRHAKGNVAEDRKANSLLGDWNMGYLILRG